MVNEMTKEKEMKKKLKKEGRGEKRRKKTNLLVCLLGERAQASFLLIFSVTFKLGIFIFPMLKMRTLRLGKVK